MTDKLKRLLEGMGCSSSDIARIAQELDESDAEDDLDEVLPLKAGKPRDLKPEDMRASDSMHRMRALQHAQELVRPYVNGGRTLLAADAAGVLRKAIGLLGFGEVDNNLPREALPEVWKLAVRQANAAKHGGGNSGARPRLAMDSASAKSFAERFPDAARVKTTF